MEIVADFFVPGIAKPAGSKRAFVPINKRTGQPFRSKTTGRVVVSVVDDSGAKGKDWRGDVKAIASREYQGEPVACPVVLEILFVMPRPKAHFRKNGNGPLRPDAPTWHTNKPDATKLLRSVEDGLTGIVWVDDNAVMPRVEKVYGDRPGARIRVTRAVDPRLFVIRAHVPEAAPALFAGATNA